MKTTLGVFTTHSAAESALNELKGFGVNEADLSYIYQNKEGELEDDQSGSKVGKGVANGATAGVIIGGIAGLIIANGVLPGFGTLFVAGPLATALGVGTVTATTVAGAATGAVAGGLIGALQHFGVEENDIHLYENHVRHGNILIIARDTTASTKDILTKQGAVEIREYTTK